jgi:hypothetical protein
MEPWYAEKIEVLIIDDNDTCLECECNDDCITCNEIDFMEEEE